MFSITFGPFEEENLKEKVNDDEAFETYFKEGGILMDVYKLNDNGVTEQKVKVWNLHDNYLINHQAYDFIKCVSNGTHKYFVILMEKLIRDLLETKKGEIFDESLQGYIMFDMRISKTNS